MRSYEWKYAIRERQTDRQRDRQTDRQIDRETNQIRRLASRALPIRSRHQKVQDLHPSPCHNAHHDVATEIQTKHAMTIGSFTFVWYRG